MIETQILKGNLIKQEHSLAFTLNQYDKNISYKINLIGLNGNSYTLDNEDIVTIEWLKPNGRPFLQSSNITKGDTYVTILIPEAVTQYAGAGSYNIIITNGGARKGTIKREYNVIGNSMRSGTSSEDVITDVVTELRSLNTELAEKVQNNQEIINSNSAATKQDIANVNSSLEEKANRSEIGSPLIASTIAEMTDTNKIYVYTGSETGYTSGNWYSYNGTSWVSGGVYNSVAINFTNKTYILNDKATIISNNQYVQAQGNMATLENSTYIKFDCDGINKVIYARTRAFVDGEGIGYYDENLNKLGYETYFEVLKTLDGYTYYLLDISKYTNIKYILTTRRYGDTWQVDYKFYDYDEFYSDGAYKVSSEILIDDEVRKKVKAISNEFENFKNDSISESSDIATKEYILNNKVTIVTEDKYVQETGDIVDSTNSSYIKFDCEGFVKILYVRDKAFVEGEGIGYYDSEMTKIGYESSITLFKSEDGYYYYLLDISKYENIKYIVTTKQFGTIWAINYKFYDYYNLYEEGIETIINKKIIDSEVRIKMAEVEKNMEFIENVNPLKNLKWTIIGDSISDETITPYVKYPTLISNKTGITIQNLAKGGHGWKNCDNYFVEAAKLIATDSDILTFMGSINDKTYTLGTATDTGTDTIGGCINTALDNAWSKNTGIRIGLISPIPSGSQIPSNTTCFLSQLSELMKEIAELRGIPFLDLFHSSNIRTSNTTFKEKFMQDDTHPNDIGQEKFLKNRIMSFITSL